MAFRMNQKISVAFLGEMEKAKEHFETRQFDKSWYHLERAHILGQRFVWPHVKVHYEMLRFGLKQKDLREILGQLIRIPGGFIGSLINKVPIGNPGGSNVKATQSFPLPDDLAKMLKDSDG